jgi:hypothetical protein
MIVAEDGERVLTPEQNAEYERLHPDARQKPMRADVYEMGGVIGKAFGKGETDQNAIKNGADSIQGVPAGNYSKPADALSGYHDAFDKGGAVQTPLGNRIADRANELYTQAKALHAPESGEAASFKEKQANIDAYKKSLEPAPSTVMKPYPSTAVDKVNPAAKTSPEEKRIDPRELQEMQKPLGSLPVYDEGGDVPTDDDRLKEAAQRQAEDEVMNGSHLAEHSPEGREEAQDAKMRRYPQPQSGIARISGDTERPAAVDASKTDQLTGANMDTKNAPLSKPAMNEQNAAPQPEQPMMSEASAKTKPSPLGQAAPQGAALKQLPGIEKPMGNGTTDHPMDPAASEEKRNEATATAAGYPVQHAEVAPPDDAMATVQADKLAAMKKGTAGLTDLGVSLIHEKTLMPKYTGSAKDMKQENQDEGKARYEQTTKELTDKMLHGATEQERFQAEKDLANYKLHTPWGGDESAHPGLLGKIGHVAARIGEGALDTYAGPELTAELIPGSKEGLMAQEGRAEHGVEGAQKEEQQAAVTKEAEQQPALREEAQKLAAQKMENTLKLAGYKTDPVTGEHVPLKYEEMSPQQQAVADKNESVQTLNEAKSHEQEAKAVLERYKADPNNAQNKAALEKLQLEGRKIAIAAGTLGIHQKEFLRDTYGVDEKGEAIPGVQTTDEGVPIGTKVAGKEAGGPLQVKGVQARNVQDNLNAAIDLIQEHPDLFGKVSGRFTSTRDMVGTNDPTIDRLGNLIHNAALASTSVHGLRGEKAVEATEKELLNHFRNSPEATIAGMQDTINSMSTFTSAATKGAKKTIEAPKAAKAPAGATNEVFDPKEHTKVIGHVVNGKYVALPK